MDKAYFIRHNLFTDDRDKEIEKKIRDTLKSQGLIAIHFNYDKISDEEWGEIPESNNPKFKKAKDAFTTLKKEGGYVLAQYDINDGVTIGKIAPGSKITYVEEFQTHKNQEYHGFKCLKFSEPPKEYSATDFPVLIALRPIQQTIAKLNDTSAEIVKQIFEKGRIKRTVEFLTPKFQELIVQEWLRSKHAEDKFKLKCQYILTGKDYPLFDITGETILGRSLYAQVTFHNKESNKKKFEDFRKREVEPEGIKIMFSNEKTPTEGNVYYKNLNEVLEDLINDSDYSGFFNKIFGPLENKT